MIVLEGHGGTILRCAVILNIECPGMLSLVDKAWICIEHSDKGPSAAVAAVDPRLGCSPDAIYVEGDKNIVVMAGEIAKLFEIVNMLTLQLQFYYGVTPAKETITVDLENWPNWAHWVLGFNCTTYNRLQFRTWNGGTNNWYIKLQPENDLIDDQLAISYKDETIQLIRK